MMNGDRLSSTAKPRKPRVKNSAKLKLDLDTTTQLSPPPLFRSNTAPGKTGTSTTSNGSRTPRSSTSISPEKEKVRSDDGFHSDSDKDSNQSAHSVHSNLSAYSGMSRAPSIKSDTFVRVRPKSSLGSVSDLSEKSHLDSLSLAHLAVNRQLQADKQAEEARKNRKIADLEISIKSLTAINAELDATNKRQAAEIIELKRKLRIDDSFMSEINDIDDDDLSSSLTEPELAEIAKENDIRFRRVCHAMDELLRDAQAALDYSTKIVGSRVLTSAQLDETVDDDTTFDLNESDSSEPEDHEEILLTLSPPSEINAMHNDPENDNMTPNESKSRTQVDITMSRSTDPRIKKPPLLKSETVTMTSDGETKSIKESPITSGSEVHSIHGDRIREVIQELLVIAKKPPEKKGLGLISSEKKGLGLIPSEKKGLGLIPSEKKGLGLIPSEKKGLGLIPSEKKGLGLIPSEKKGLGLIPSEKKGLGLILSVQNGHTPHVHGTGDPPSPALILLYELQELLGIGDAESSKYINENRTPGRNNFLVDSPVDKDDDVDDSIPSLRSQFDSVIDNARIIRRRSSPLMSYRSSEILDADYASDSNLHSHDANAGKPLTWASSLGFWTRWKV